MSVATVAMGFVVLPIPIVNISVGVDQPSLAIGLVVHPVALIDTAIAPDLVASAVPPAGDCVPLAFVLCIIRKYLQVVLFQNHIWVVFRLLIVNKLVQGCSYLLYLPLLFL